MLIFYHLFLFFYNLFIRVAATWNPKAKRWVDGRKGIFEKLSSELKTHNSGLIWFHCASLGEFEQGRPVMEKIKIQNPKSKILLTFFSPSGYEVQKNYKGADWVFYLPMDSAANAKKFIDIVKPLMVIFVKYEFWFYYLEELTKRKIPAFLISAIFLPKHPFFQWYGSLHKQMLNCFNHIFVQNESSKKLLAKIGFTENVSISGDTRFDRVIEIAEKFEPIPLIESFIADSKKVVVAGSTWPEDEEEMNHYANTHADVKFIIAPHEIDEEHLLEMEKLFKYSIRFSQLRATSYELRDIENNTPPSGSNGLLWRGRGANVLIIDNIGMLSRLYKYATVTFVGGGFEDDGVHNVLEAAVYGKPVIFGPVIDKYAEAVELEAGGGGIVVNSVLELEEELNDLFGDEKYLAECGEASLDYVYSHKGASEKIMEYLYKNLLRTKS